MYHPAKTKTQLVLHYFWRALIRLYLGYSYDEEVSPEREESVHAVAVASYEHAPPTYNDEGQNNDSMYTCLVEAYLPLPKLPVIFTYISSPSPRLFVFDY